MAYDSSNIFAKMIRGEISCQKILENEHALAFYDLYPKAPIHILVIPKGDYENSADFYRHANAFEVTEFYQLLDRVIEHLQLEQGGFRLVSNCGKNAGQEVPHFHVHILAGGPLGSGF